MLIATALVLLGLNAWLLWQISRAKLEVHRFCILPLWLAVAFEVFTVLPATVVAWLRGSTLLFTDYGPSVVLETDALPLVAWSCAFLGLLVGYIVSGGSSRGQALRAKRFLQEPRSERPSDPAIAFTGLVMLLTLTAAGLFYYQGVPPLLDAFSFDDSLSQGAATMREQRKAISKGHFFGEAYRGQGIALVAMALGFPWLGALVITNAGWRRKWWTAALVVVTAFAFIFLAGGGIRSRFVEMLVVLFIAATAGKMLTLRKIAGLSAAVVLVTVGLSVVTGKVELSGGAVATTVNGLEKVAHRIAFGNGSNNITVIELVRREVIPMGMGRLHLDKLANAVPGIQRAPFAQEIAEIVSFREGQITTFASMTGLGFGYAEGGIPGSVALYLVAGIGIGLFERWMFTLRKNALNLATIAVTTLLAGKLSFLNMISFSVNFTVCAAIALSFLALASLYDWFALRRRIPAPGDPARSHA